MQRFSRSSFHCLFQELEVATSLAHCAARSSTAAIRTGLNIVSIDLWLEVATSRAHCRVRLLRRLRRQFVTAPVPGGTIDGIAWPETCWSETRCAHDKWRRPVHLAEAAEGSSSLGADKGVQASRELKLCHHCIRRPSHVSEHTWHSKCSHCIDMLSLTLSCVSRAIKV